MTKKKVSTNPPVVTKRKRRGGDLSMSKEKLEVTVKPVISRRKCEVDHGLRHWKKVAGEKKAKLNDLQKERLHLLNKRERVERKKQHKIELVKKEFCEQDNSIRAKLVVLQNSIKVAKSDSETADLYYRNPIVKHLTCVFPKEVISIITDYDSSHICPECKKYMPRISICSKTKGHYFVAGNFTADFGLFPEHNKPLADYKFKWEISPKQTLDNQAQQMWDICTSVVIEKARFYNLKQTITSFKLQQQQPNDARNHFNNYLWISSNSQCLTVSRGRNGATVFKMNNEVKKRVVRKRERKNFLIGELKAEKIARRRTSPDAFVNSDSDKAVSDNEITDYSTSDDEHMNKTDTETENNESEESEN